MDRLTAAEVFVDVAYTKSFTATAQRLEMSRPMVTRYIEAMESWLQTRLLHRTTRKISLTSEGERYLREVEIWLNQAKAMTTLRPNSSHLSGTIRLAASMSFGFSILAPIVSQFMSMHPQVSIDMDLQDSVADLVEQRIDLAIRIASHPAPSLIGKPIGVCDSVLVASPDYLMMSPALNEPEDLRRHHCLGYRNFDIPVWHLYRQQRLSSIEVHCQLTANEATTLLHAAINGAGVAQQPLYLAKPLIDNGQLIHVLPEWAPNPMQIYALYSSRNYLSPSVRAFIDFAENALKTALPTK